MAIWSKEALDWLKADIARIFYHEPRQRQFEKILRRARLREMCRNSVNAYWVKKNAEEYKVEGE
jgi:hypothetical protein